MAENNDAQSAVTCAGCGKRLSDVQIETRNKPDSAQWLREGFHSFQCYKQHHVGAQRDIDPSQQEPSKSKQDTSDKAPLKSRGSPPTTTEPEKIKWAFRPRRWWIVLSAFLLLCIIGDYLDVVLGLDGDYGWGYFISVAVAIIIAIISAFTGRKKVYQRRDRRRKTLLTLGWLAILPFAHGILVLGLFALIGILPLPEISLFSEHPILFPTLAVQIPLIPLVLWALWRSRLFVEPTLRKSEPSTNKDAESLEA